IEVVCGGIYSSARQAFQALEFAARGRLSNPLQVRKEFSMAVETYKNVVIGSGEGGKYLAWHLASSGEKTIVVERRWIGGSCPNINCLPSKNEIWSAKVANLAQHADRFGSTPSPAPVNMAAVRSRKRAMVSGLVAMHLEKYKASGAELLMGEARFTG